MFVFVVYCAGGRRIDAPLRLPRLPSSGNRADLHCQPGGPYPPCWWRPLCRPTQGPQASPNIKGTRVLSASATPSSGDHSPLGSLITVMRGRRQSAGNLIPLEPSQCPACTRGCCPKGWLLSYVLSIFLFFCNPSEPKAKVCVLVIPFINIVNMLFSLVSFVVLT